jgi:hypothetical protein
VATQRHYQSGSAAQPTGVLQRQPDTSSSDRAQEARAPRCFAALVRAAERAEEPLRCAALRSSASPLFSAVLTARVAARPPPPPTRRRREARSPRQRSAARRQRQTPWSTRSSHARTARGAAQGHARHARQPARLFVARYLFGNGPHVLRHQLRGCRFQLFLWCRLKHGVMYDVAVALLRNTGALLTPSQPPGRHHAHTM